MNKIIISILLAGMLTMLAGCGAGSEEIKLASEAPSESAVTPEPPAENSQEPPSEAPGVIDVEQRLGDALKDAYTGIEIDAFVRERKAILPGAAVPVTVTVKNTGDEAVDYILGSGSYTTPEALFINMEGLQTVRPKDHLGMVTMDFRTEELMPGDMLEYVIYVMAIEPNAKFDAYTVDMYGASGEYIAEKSWDELQNEFPDLSAAKPDSYNGQAYFLYYTRNESGVPDFTKMPDGYAECDFSIGVS